MNQELRKWVLLGAVISGTLGFAAYHDAPSDTEDSINVAASLSDAQSDALVAGLARK